MNTKYLSVLFLSILVGLVSASPAPAPAEKRLEKRQGDGSGPGSCHPRAPVHQATDCPRRIPPHPILEAPLRTISSRTSLGSGCGGVARDSASSCWNPPRQPAVSLRSSFGVIRYSLSVSDMRHAESSIIASTRFAESSRRSRVRSCPPPFSLFAALSCGVFSSLRGGHAGADQREEERHAAGDDDEREARRGFSPEPWRREWLHSGGTAVARVGCAVDRSPARSTTAALAQTSCSFTTYVCRAGEIKTEAGLRGSCEEDAERCGEAVRHTQLTSDAVLVTHSCFSGVIARTHAAHRPMSFSSLASAGSSVMLWDLADELAFGLIHHDKPATEVDLTGCLAGWGIGQLRRMGICALGGVPDEVGVLPEDLVNVSIVSARFEPSRVTVKIERYARDATCSASWTLCSRLSVRGEALSKMRVTLGGSSRVKIDDPAIGNLGIADKRQQYPEGKMLGVG
ncbi:uncharacterized protein LAESUDRAFT_710723 [Laetiporus sulphureus 93-53]|uniref:Uncharacterized protein n=1 Tax=Laetiporus sulphureus 93-53 TaxID=1314785 RepID=A0A165H1J7_9APHY|nr:uncharacterized protein LAESUDRAFT_710723 [Laetiporus sulphureus 93-53]KZT11115.1 hypothetical protein LAESUDRAFT_710723 [Laetiporus sulphureus 93-53]